MNQVIQFFKENEFHHYKIKEPLKKHCYIRAGGLADVLFPPQNETEMIHTILFLAKEGIPYKVIGKGSNILFSDEDYKGVIIKNTMASSQVEINDDSVIVGGSASLVKLSYNLAKQGYSGLEFSSGIPGTVGGALYMNAGAYNVEMKDVVVWVKYIDEEGIIRILHNEDCLFRYRNSIFKEQLTDAVILETKIKLHKEDPVVVLDVIKSRKERRHTTQPLDYPSCGSVFKNPLNDHAYLYIDRVGLRGYRIGGAKFSEKHCNFIINDEQAKASDIRDLIELATKKVFDTYQIKLIKEVELFNW